MVFPPFFSLIETNNPASGRRPRPGIAELGEAPVPRGAVVDRVGAVPLLPWGRQANVATQIDFTDDGLAGRCAVLWPLATEIDGIAGPRAGERSATEQETLVRGRMAGRCDRAGLGTIGDVFDLAGIEHSNHVAEDEIDISRNKTVAQVGALTDSVQPQRVLVADEPHGMQDHLVATVVQVGDRLVLAVRSRIIVRVGILDGQ